MSTPSPVGISDHVDYRTVIIFIIFMDAMAWDPGHVSVSGGRPPWTTRVPSAIGPGIGYIIRMRGGERGAPGGSRHGELRVARPGVAIVAGQMTGEVIVGTG